MRILSSLAIGLLCLMCGLALSVGLEVNHDQCGLLGLSTGTSFIDAIAPTGYATLSIGLVAGYAWWADQAERSFAVEFVVVVVAFLFVMFFFFLTTTVASHFLLMNMARELPWMKHLVSSGYVCGMVVVFRKVRRALDEAKKSPPGE